MGLSSDYLLKLGLVIRNLERRTSIVQIKVDHG